MVIKELVTQLEPLKQEKDDAIKYKRLKSEHDELDIILTGIDLKTSEEVVKNLKNDVTKLNEEINNIDNTNLSDSSII